jgi:hypothetical protein
MAAKEQVSHILWIELKSSCMSGSELWGVAVAAIEGLKKNCGQCRYCEKLSKVCIGMEGFDNMSKRELIDCICEINKTARAEFLAKFSEEELKDYLEHLMELDLEEILVCA